MSLIFFLQVDYNCHSVIEKKPDFFVLVSISRPRFRRIMMENKQPDIIIHEAGIFGIVHPQLIVSGRTSITPFRIEVTVQGRAVPVQNNDVPGEGLFKVFADLGQEDHDVLVVLIDQETGERHVIFQENTSAGKRLVQQIGRIWEKAGRSVRAVFITLGKGISFFWKNYHFLVPPKLWRKYWNDYKNRVKFRAEVGEEPTADPDNVEQYGQWITDFETMDEPTALESNPLLSVIIPVYNVSGKLLAACLDSLLDQSYPNFEVCLVDDASTLPETGETLREYAQKDSRIRISRHPVNQHIARTTNDAAAMARGEFLVLMDDDDTLSPNALYEVAKAINDDPSVDFLYSDEDKLDAQGRRCYPHFKADYSPDTLMSLNYMSHLGVIRKSLFFSVGGEDDAFPGAQDYDLYLKIVEQTDHISHIAKVLYHWRMAEGSTAMALAEKNYALENGCKALEAALERRGLQGTVDVDRQSLYYVTQYSVPSWPLVSIIIPDKDYPAVLEKCLASIFEKTVYPNFEVIVMDNNSSEPKTFKLFESYQSAHDNFRVVKADYPFNYSKINNDAVSHCSGDYLCLLNNDTEVISPDWLNVLVGYAMQPHIGAVGPKLLYPDSLVQHAGVVMGMGGVASHIYVGAAVNQAGYYGRLRVPYNYSVVTGACLVVAKKKYLAVGGLDENLQVAYNDVDFCLKLSTQGYFNLLAPQVLLHHFESKTRGYENDNPKFTRFQQEQKYMYEKWPQVIRNDPFYNPNLSRYGYFRLPIEGGQS